MRNTKHNSKKVGIVLLLLLFFTFSACTDKMTFKSSSVVPAAKGSVKMKSDNNKNHIIDVSVTDLAPANQLTPPKKIYVVWMVTKNNETKNLGQLVSETSFMSDALKGSLNAVTPFEPNYFFITAEDEGSASFPGTIVLNMQ
jgi:hypothetical protein